MTAPLLITKSRRNLKWVAGACMSGPGAEPLSPSQEGRSQRGRPGRKPANYSRILHRRHVMARTIPDVRITPDTSTVIANLGLLGDLGGTWQGKGFNLIARPDFQGDAPLYLQLNQTEETLKIDPIGSPIPNRGFGQDDMELFGLTYLQQIVDAGHDGALHIEPGIWVTQPNTTFPAESVNAPAQLVARMGTIPHGHS